MIAADQPTLHPAVRIIVSSRDDGTVLDRSRATHDGDVLEARRKICEAADFDYAQAVFQRIIYSPDACYDLLAEVDERSTTQYTDEIVADGLMTAAPGVALFLPVADCVATVLFDPITKRLALLHLGRHSTLTKLLPRTIERFLSEGSRPEDLLVWMSPSAQKQSYALEYFEHADDPAWAPYIEPAGSGYRLDMQGFNAAVCEDAGIRPENVHRSMIDTVTDDRYFSHSAGDTYGRFAVIAMLA